MRVAAVLIVCLFGFAACSGASKNSQAGSTSDPAAHSSTTGSGGSNTNGTAAPNKPVATVDDVTTFGDAQQRLRLSIYDLRRQGPYLVLDFGIVCLTPAANCDTEFAFARPSTSGDSIASGSSSQTDSYSTAGGVTLIDANANLQYQAVTDSQDHPYSSDVEGINDSYQHLEWVKFAAPPSSVHSLDVVFPGTGPVVSHVPITNSAAPSAPQVGPNAVPASPANNAPPVDSIRTTGMTRPVEKLLSTVGNPAGSDFESPGNSTLVLNTDVVFAFGKADLTRAATTVIQNLAARIKGAAAGPVTVTGYTDSIGTDDVNVPLSQARAAAVVAALKPLTPGVSYASSGKGSADPVAPNTNSDGSDNPAGRALNRRVTIAYSVKASVQPTPPPAVSSSTTPAPSSRRTAAYRATQPLGGGFVDYNVKADGLSREGNLAVLRLEIICGRAVGDNNSCGGFEDFAGTDSAPPIPLLQLGGDLTGSAGQLVDTMMATHDTASGFYLHDPATGTSYAPLHLGQYGRLGQPITAQLPDNNTWPTNVTYPAWIYFPAPPKSTTALQVMFPGGNGSIDNVPINPSAGG